MKELAPVIDFPLLPVEHKHHGDIHVTLYLTRFSDVTSEKHIVQLETTGS